MVDRQACLGIAAQGLALALAFGQLAAQALETLRRRRQADAYPRTGGVEDVDGLVRQLATRQVAGGQFGGGHHRVVAQVDTVAFLVNPGQATQDRHRLGNARLMQLHGLEAPGQRRVLLEILLVFGPGRRRDGAQLATCQGRLEQVGGIRAAGLTARADQRMGLVDEQDGRPGRCLHFVDDAFQAPLELALHAGTGLQQAHVEGQQLDIPQRRRHFPCGDPRGQAFDDGGLADASLADHDGVVFPPTGQDVDHLANSPVATEHRIELAVARLLGKVVGETLQQGLAAARLAAGRPLQRLREREILQPLDVEPRQQRLVAAAGIAQRVA